MHSTMAVRPARQAVAGRVAVTLPQGGAGFLSAVPPVTDRLGPGTDSAIIVFGMNDHLLGPDYLPEFTRLLRESVMQLQQLRKKVILVGFF